jgi:exodeoxyribonuclease VII large subunit
VETRRRDLRALTRALPQPDALLTTPRQRLDQASLRLGQALTRGTMAQRGRLDRVAGRLTPRLITQGLSERLRAVSVQGDRLDRALDQRRQRQEDRLANLGSRVSPRAVEHLAGEGRKALARLDGAMLRAMRQQLTVRRDKVAQRAKLLDAFNYRRVLDRGFAVIRDEAGTPLRQVAALDAAGAVQIELADGTRDAVVGGATDGPPPTAPKAKPGRTKRVVDARPGPKQENLFD